MALISRELLKKRPQELGRIKIGGKGKKTESRKGNTFRPPVKFDHFVVTTMERGPDENFIRDEEIHDKVGDKPTELEGILMFDRPADNFHSEMAIYKGRGKDGKVLSCDGETATKLATGEENPCVMANGGECKCKPYARLHIQLWASPHTLGYHVFRTTSWESTNNIQSALEEIYNRFGTCYNAPVKLVLYPSEDRHDKGVSTSYKVGLVLAMSMGEAAHKIAEAREYLAIASGEVKQLAAGVHRDQEERDHEDARHIGEEFYPPDRREVHRASVVEELDQQHEDDDPDYEVVDDEAESEPPTGEAEEEESEGQLTL